MTFFDACGFDTVARWRFLDHPLLGTGSGEDTLLGWQAVRSGADVRFVPDAVVEHQVFPRDLRDMSSRIAQVAAFPAMVKEVPELRQTLLARRVFLGNYVRVPFYVTVLALVARRRRMAALALLWWVGVKVNSLRHSPYPTVELLPWLPAEMATDVALAAAPRGREHPGAFTRPCN